MMPLIDVSTGRVIQEIQIRPVLWDPKDANSKNKSARREAWQEVFCALMPDFKEMSAIDQKNADRAIQQRWKTARDAYFRSKSSIPKQGKIKKKYFYYDNLSFLDKIHNDDSSGSCNQCTEPALSPTLCDPIQNDSDSLQVHTAMVKLENDSEESNDEYNPDCTITPEITINPINTEICDGIDLGSKSLKRKLDNDLNSTICELLTENAHQLRNDNMTFFLSMLPIVDKFSDLQKLTFRAEVINIAKKIAQENN